MSKAAIPATTASDAPASTPSSAGSASGLRVTPCITAPASPRAAADKKADHRAGTRSSRMMRWSLFVGSNSKKASTIVSSGIAFEP